MTTSPAGWQPDPRGRHEYRYWNGTQWTDHVADNGVASKDPVSDVSEPVTGATAESRPAAATEVQPAAGSAPGVAGARPGPAVEGTASGGAQAGGATGGSVRGGATPGDAGPGPAGAPTGNEPPGGASPSGAFESRAAATGAGPSAAGPSGASTGGRAAWGEGPAATRPATGATRPHGGAPSGAQGTLQSRSPEVASILSVVAPGSGHFYVGSPKVPLAAGLLVATAAAVVLAYFSLLLFIIGFVLWAAAAAFALTDLRGGVGGLGNTTLASNLAGIVLIAAGAVLIISLLLPWYHFSFETNVFGRSTSGSDNFSGFTALGVIDIVLLFIGVAAILAGAATLGLGPISAGELPSWLPMAVAVGGAVAALLILFRMFVDPIPGVPSGLGVAGASVDISVGRAPGILLALAAALVLLLANAAALRSGSATAKRR